METRITNHLDEYLSAIDGKLAGALGEMYTALAPDRREQVRRIFVDAVHEVILLAKQGKNIHERFVQNVVLNAVDAIVGFDLDDKVFFWNRGAETTFGFAREEAVGRTYEIILPDGQNYREELRTLRERTFSTGFVRDHHTERRTKDGRILQISLSRTLVTDEFDQPLGCIAILRDMTEMRLLERQLIQNEKLALIGQIAAGMAHEIGTPLNIISGIAEVLLLDRDAAHPEREDLEAVISQTERIANLVRDLLAFSRPRQMRVHALDLNVEARRAVNLIRGRIEKRGIDIELRLADALPAVAADDNHIQQVLLNLLVNASDALGDAAGDRHRRIAIATGRDADGGAFLRVDDTGPGIPPDLLPRIFEPFVTTKEVGKGTGLGLAVCRRIVEDHGGTIEAANLPDGGASFVLRFPPAAGTPDA